MTGSNSNLGHVVLTCSALRRSHRDVIRTAEAQVRFLHLDATAEELAARLTGPTDHFMSVAMLDSQLATLEPLQGDEDGVVVHIGGTPQQVADRAMHILRLAERDPDRRSERGALTAGGNGV